MAKDKQGKKGKGKKKDKTAEAAEDDAGAGDEPVSEPDGPDSETTAEPDEADDTAEAKANDDGAGSEPAAGASDANPPAPPGPPPAVPAPAAPEPEKRSKPGKYVIATAVLAALALIASTIAIIVVATDDDWESRVHGGSYIHPQGGDFAENVDNALRECFEELGPRAFLPECFYGMGDNAMDEFLYGLGEETLEQYFLGPDGDLWKFFSDLERGGFYRDGPWPGPDAYGYGPWPSPDDYGYGPWPGPDDYGYGPWPSPDDYGYGPWPGPDDYGYGPQGPWPGPDEWSYEPGDNIGSWLWFDTWDDTDSAGNAFGDFTACMRQDSGPLVDFLLDFMFGGDGLSTSPTTTTTLAPGSDAPPTTTEPGSFTRRTREELSQLETALNACEHLLPDSARAWMDVNRGFLSEIKDRSSAVKDRGRSRLRS